MTVKVKTKKVVKIKNDKEKGEREKERERYDVEQDEDDEKQDKKKEEEEENQEEDEEWTREPSHIIQQFQNEIKQLPSDWIVCQMGIIESPFPSLLFTRFEKKSKTPIVMAFPLF